MTDQPVMPIETSGRRRLIPPNDESINRFPPSDVHDADLWNRYWLRQIQSEMGHLERAFGDMMASDERLVSRLRARGARTIACLGNGLSSEAPTLALYGFDVTALDLSSVPAYAMLQLFSADDHPFRRVPGCSVTDGILAFNGTGELEPDVAPALHRGPVKPRRGGSLRYLTGDLTDLAVCPGPFDVVIERRTIQLFPEADRALALTRAAARLKPAGLFISQQHWGAWKPHLPRTHFAHAWCQENGFTLDIECEAGAIETPSKCAWLVLTTG